MTLSAHSQLSSRQGSVDCGRRRQDVELEIKFEQALQESAYREVRNVRCRCEAGEVKLLGEVSSFYLKQMAQKALQQLGKVPKIVNQLVVRAEAPHHRRKAR